MGDIHKVLRNLGVVGQMKQNDKLLTQGDYFSLYTPTYMRGVYRMWLGEGRELNVNRVHEEVNSAKAYITNVLADQRYAVTDDANIKSRLGRHTQAQLCTRAMRILHETQAGLQNMRETYREDTALLCRIEHVANDVSDFLDGTRRLTSREDGLEPKGGESLPCIGE